MKFKLLILTLLLTPTAYAQESLKLSCINGNIQKIKKESKCEIYVEQLKSIKEPNCIYSATLLAASKIMTEAKSNQCLIEAPKTFNANKKAPVVFNYQSTSDVGNLLKHIEAYNQEIGLKAN